MSEQKEGDLLVGRPKKHQTRSAKKRARNEAQKRRDRTRVFLLNAYPRWMKLREELKLESSELADLLIDRYEEPVLGASFCPLTSTPKAPSVLSGIEPLDTEDSEEAERTSIPRFHSPEEMDPDKGDQSEEENLDENEANLSWYLPTEMSLKENTEEMRENDKLFNVDHLEQVSDETLVHNVSWPTEEIPPIPSGNGISPKDAVQERGCIAYESSLLELAEMSITNCKTCGAQLAVEVTTRGTSFYLKWKCSNGHPGPHWMSQPPLPRKGVLLGDFMLCSNIILSGNNFTKIALLLKFINIATPSSSTYDRLQSMCVIPAIDDYWYSYQQQLQSQFKDVPIVVAGDGRNDSPGYCAKFLTYTLMEHESYTILELQIVDKREVGGKSPNMEKTGLLKCLEAVENAGITITELVTDAHRQIACWMRTEKSGIIHQWDIWHAAKNLSKHLNNIASSHPDLQPWCTDVIRHFWYSSENASGDVTRFLSIWRSVMQHTVGQHTWLIDDGLGILGCAHGPTEEDPIKPYLEMDSSAHEALRGVVFDKKRVLSVAHHYTNFRHTGQLEIFHHHVLMYCSKRFSFRYPAYRARHLVAAIDYNKHLNRAPRWDKNNEIVYGRIFNKRSQNWSAVILKEAKKYDYIRDIQEGILNTRIEMDTSLQAKRELSLNDGRRIKGTIAPVSPPPVYQLVNDHRSRFAS